MNADESFDQYYASMKKKKAGMTGSMDNTVGQQDNNNRESIFGVV